MFGDKVALASRNTHASVIVRFVQIPNLAYIFICVPDITDRVLSTSALRLSFPSRVSHTAGVNVLTPIAMYLAFQRSVVLPSIIRLAIEFRHISHVIFSFFTSCNIFPDTSDKISLQELCIDSVDFIVLLPDKSR